MLVLNITVLVLSFIYVLIGRYTNQNNAKHLFAGYRGMSESEREKYVIKGIVKFFKPFRSPLILIGIITTVITPLNTTEILGSLIALFLGSLIALFLGTLP